MNDKRPGHDAVCVVDHVEQISCAAAMLTTGGKRLFTVDPRHAEWCTTGHALPGEPDGLHCADVMRPIDRAEDVQTRRTIEALTDWYMEVARSEIEQIAPKAVEYGPNSMIEVGRAMGRMSGRDLSDQDAIEVACMFYICGKLGRWVDAVAHGKKPSDDTIHDIGVYIKMAQRNRAVGGWPFAPNQEEN